MKYTKYEFKPVNAYTYSHLNWCLKLSGSYFFQHAPYSKFDYEHGLHITFPLPYVMFQIQVFMYKHCSELGLPTRRSPPPLSILFKRHGLSLKKILVDVFYII